MQLLLRETNYIAQASSPSVLQEPHFKPVAATIKRTSVGPTPCFWVVVDPGTMVVLVQKWWRTSNCIANERRQGTYPTNPDRICLTATFKILSALLVYYINPTPLDNTATKSASIRYPIPEGYTPERASQYAERGRIKRTRCCYATMREKLKGLDFIFYLSCFLCFEVIPWPAF